VYEDVVGGDVEQRHRYAGRVRLFEQLIEQQRVPVDALAPGVGLTGNVERERRLIGPRRAQIDAVYGDRLRAREDLVLGLRAGLHVGRAVHRLSAQSARELLQPAPQHERVPVLRQPVAQRALRARPRRQLAETLAHRDLERLLPAEVVVEVVVEDLDKQPVGSEALAHVTRLRYEPECAAAVLGRVDHLDARRALEPVAERLVELDPPARCERVAEQRDPRDAGRALGAPVEAVPVAKPIDAIAHAELVGEQVRLDVRLVRDQYAAVAYAAL
jgi:hypothetical protein